MSAKTVPLSVRISEEDQEFLLGLKLAGATTPSDKVRALIGQARTVNQAPRSYQASLELVGSLLEETDRRRRQFEAGGAHSALLATVMEWLPDVAALLITGPSGTGPSTGATSASSQAPAASRAAITRDAREASSMHELEAALAARVMRLLDSVLRLGITARAPCYDPAVIGRQLAPLIDLVQAIANLDAGRDTAHTPSHTPVPAA